MKTIYKILVVGFMLFTTQLFSQEYVKFIETPPMIVEQKSNYINGFKIKYNIPTSGFLYLTLFKDGKPIGNSVKKVTRGKRIIETNLMIWDGGNSLTRKGEYIYRLEVFKGPKNDFTKRITKATPIDSIKVVKKLQLK